MQTATHPQPTTTRSDYETLPSEAIQLAAEILKASQARATQADKANLAKVAGLIEDKEGKELTVAMADQVLRIKNPRRSAHQLQSLIQQHGLPKYFGLLDRCLLQLGSWAAQVAPGLVMPLVRKRIQAESSHVIISAEEESFTKYLAERKREGIRVNLNQLGEAVLGNAEAERRLEKYLQRLSDPAIRYVSVKLSSVAAHISLTGYAQTLATIKARLRILYRAAMQDGPGQHRFINLDMEEYRDLYLTVDVFRSVLDEPEFKDLSAGIVLQAYLPDSHEVQKSLTAWARQRVADGGADIKIRLVKGANLAMEQVEASIHGWPQAPYHTKTETDANYKRMVEFALRPENMSGVRIGLASHNLFDISFALLLAEKRNVRQRVEFEMLEGMANAQAHEVRDRTGDLLVYAPICYDADFDSAVAYLVRRFDENTQPGSFLGSLFNLTVDSPAWDTQSQMFLDACQLAWSGHLSTGPNRIQNRAAEHFHPTAASEPFYNTPNTDFAVPANRDWIGRLVAEWKAKTFDTLPVAVGGQEVKSDTVVEGHDPSRPGHILYRYSCGDASQVELALATASQAQPGWEKLGVAKRAEILRSFAAVAADERGDLIGVMMGDAGKAVVESDAEISEAIDFAEYYSRALDTDGWRDGTTSAALGVVVVTPPWNFPYAIPAGGCLAALMAGNTVILKPAPETVLTAWYLACQLWKAGVPRDVLQFLPLVDGENGTKLLSDDRVGAVVLTGAYATAKLFKSWKPNMRLYAETSGKNSMIISSAADLDLALKDLVQGAFGHAGQKCSATSLAIVQRDVYESEQFRNQLRDAAASMHVASAWDLTAEVTPIIREPHAELRRGLTQLEPGETWLLEPKMVDGNPCLWSPGIRLGVKPGSWYHRTECFGPVLGIIPVDTLEEAIRIQNDSEFGLTGGLYSLDIDEIAQWRDAVEVGNAYINRSTTGAIVQRQPFGGWKHSSVGTGAKAGGPNYVASFRHWRQTSSPALGLPLTDELSELLNNISGGEELRSAAQNYLYWWNTHFSREHDPSQLHGEGNHFRYRPLAFHAVRLTDGAEQLDALKAVVLCHLAGVHLQLSAASLPAWIQSLAQQKNISLHTEDATTFVQRMGSQTGGSVRVLGNIASSEFQPLHTQANRLVASVVLANGRLEWLNYLKEQSVTEIVHRHGNTNSRPQAR
ncbi:proline dehydrogenase family protein [Blastopirellula marina]|uniref:L-glutamate gamma-semialdehyde dehydrogenase n=1 Tax=Blastopirellula marina TaxID=124 RepID=A0A2S8G8T8_9BACT|nr:bifunctional proline dehydrogenase/L-glutamate gamma-semialdehyde dehydrogenase [Blastopirellula marina]PQO40691.1 1-pyrroline-5-carboxylate dehydrogenase [Blastopirellula marina]PTL45651.1 1-pyrroline-5-carboxylate dehydrogenase [Blastopirellula marina]